MTLSEPAETTLLEWRDQLGSSGATTQLVVVGPSWEKRREAYWALARDSPKTAVDTTLRSQAWRVDGLAANIASRMDWAQLGMMLAESQFDLSTQLLRVINRGFPESARLLQSISEVRFSLHERKLKKAKALLWTLDHYTRGVEVPSVDRKALLLPEITSDAQRYNLVMLWLTLARENGLLDRVIFPVDALDKTGEPFDEQLSLLLRATDLWSEAGCPLGIALGFQRDPEHLERLGDEVEEVRLF